MKRKVQFDKAPADSNALFATSDWVSHIEGEMLTIIEGLGLKESQEKAAKSFVRQRLWDSFEDWGFITPTLKFQKFLQAECEYMHEIDGSRKIGIELLNNAS